jgi:hypothetical protein
MGKFLNKFKDKISVINKDGHIGVVLNSKQPVQKEHSLPTRNLISCLKKNLQAATQDKAESRNIKGLLGKLRSQNLTKFDEIRSKHMLHNSKAQDFLEPNTLNSKMTKETDHSTSKFIA